MKLRNPEHISGSTAFTLLELVVVLAILSIVTALAVRTLDGVHDQQRYEASVRTMQDLGYSVLGSPDDRAADGARTVSGFVADMGRLPHTTLSADGTYLELGELWMNPGAAFDIRQAIVTNGVLADDEDTLVLVPGGWRGPYMRLPLGATTLLDAYGNPITSPLDASPPNPDTTGYARLRDATDAPITATGQEVRIIRQLGANGLRNAGDTGYNSDSPLLTFSDDTFTATLSGTVEILDTNTPPSPLAADSTMDVTIRVFGPDPTNAGQIKVFVSSVNFTTNPVNVTVTGCTIGPRIVRAYLNPKSTPSTSVTTRTSAVKQASLRSGPNLISLTIDRAFTTP